MEKIKKIAILTSGGDAPGMNAIIRAAVRAALERKVKVYGVKDGYKGLVEGDIFSLKTKDVANIINRGGTVLYSARCPEFKEEEAMRKAIANCEARGIQGLIVIGGDGTLRGGTDLTNRGLPTIGVPGSIDNDFTASDYCVGFDTAMNTVIDMVDRLRDTCESHLRCNVVEVMGRDAGHIALRTGIATGASAIAVNEIPFDEEACIQKLLAQKAAGKHSFIVIVAEGRGDFGEQLTKRIEDRTGIESRFARLAHVQRGGEPTLRDRLTGTLMGVKAVEVLLAGEKNRVICEQGGKIVSLDINYTQKLDKMYKGKLTDEQLAAMDPIVRSEMEVFCAMRKSEIEALYRTAQTVTF